MSRVLQTLPMFAYLAIILVAGMLCFHVSTFALSCTRVLWRTLMLSIPPALAAVGVWLATGIESAMVLLISVSVAGLLAGGGLAMLAAPRPRSNGKPPAVRNRMASQVLPLAACLLFAGFSARLTTAAIVSLAIIAVIGIDLAISLPPDTPEQQRPSRGVSLAASLIALLPAAIIVFASNQMFHLASAIFPSEPAEVAAVDLLAPALVLPLLHNISRRACKGGLTASLDTCSLFVTTNIGLVLPLLVGLDLAMRYSADHTAGLPRLDGVSWRVDGGMLLVGGLAVMGLRFRMLRPERWLAFIHLILYAAYLMASNLLRARVL